MYIRERMIDLHVGFYKWQRGGKISESVYVLGIDKKKCGTELVLCSIILVNGKIKDFNSVIIEREKVIVCIFWDASKAEF